MKHNHEHQHKHNHKEDQHSETKNGLTLAFWLNLIFAMIEVVGGIFTNSTAIIADAFHDFIDAIAIGIAVLFEKISGKKRSTSYSYGYKRFSLLSALGLSLFLLIGAVFMIKSGIESFIQPKEVNSVGMLWLAVLGVSINGFAFLRIKNGNGKHHHHHHHAHGHSHNQNSKAIMLHLLEDVLGWVAVLMGAVVIYFTGWNWIDGLLTLAIAAFISYNATKNLISTLKIMLQAVPEHVNLKNLTTELNNIEGVADIHDFHIWSLDGNYHVASLHAVLDSPDNPSENKVYTTILERLNKYNIQHPTVQIETNTKHCKFVNC
ncbi:cation transporter [Marivirga lumbricoides]|uniref:Cation transporter n=1 Tax=Marivirga lumbricoides TaxID=1046115 RepID=A0A2T4DT26_9BACT|nr:cation transporter [Marivirga lumbricoides]